MLPDWLKARVVDCGVVSRPYAAWDAPHHLYKVVFKSKRTRRQVTMQWRTGLGVVGKVSPALVLAVICQECLDGKVCFKDWADRFGYPYSRQARQAWQIARKHQDRLRRLGLTEKEIVDWARTSRDEGALVPELYNN